MKTLILGGTFDPVHLGHLFLADEARGLLGYARVIFVPTNRPAHKETERGASAAHRLAEMVELIVAHRSTERTLEFAYPHRYIDNALLPITSTEIRRRIAGGS